MPRDHLAGMGRLLRIHQPGCAFHIFARTQGKEEWFTDDIKDSISDAILDGVIAVQARTAAFVVMDNHFHLVLFQGAVPLGWVMQPIMRKIAHIVQKRHRLRGHVFANRYRAKLCADAEYLPTGIAYVHKNPVKAGMCAKPENYAWSSARAYEGLSADARISHEDGLKSFCSWSSSLDDLRDAYRAFMNRQQTLDTDGYWNWLERESRMRSKRTSMVPIVPHAVRRTTVDVRDAAHRIMRAVDPTIDPEVIRSRYGDDDVVRVRHIVIEGLSQRGYQGVQIARYMRVSNATVSRIRGELRKQRIAAIVEPAKRKTESGSE